MHHCSSLAGLLVPVLVLGCVSGPDAAGVTIAGPGPATLPPSALSGVVRALETIDAAPRAGAVAQVRALECDSCVDSAHGRTFARLFLDLTVYASTAAEAREAFEEVRAALEAEAGTTTRSALADEERVARAFAELDERPEGGEELVSFSDRIRLEFEPGKARAVALAPEAEQELPHQAFDAYVRECAFARRLGQVAIQPGHPTGPRPPGVGSYRIVPAFDFARFTCADIAGFLAAVEGGSPAMRLTRIKIERSQHEPDPHNPRGWTFEAELTSNAVTGAESAVL